MYHFRVSGSSGKGGANYYNLPHQILRASAGPAIIGKCFLTHMKFTINAPETMKLKAMGKFLICIMTSQDLPFDYVKENRLDPL